jgi:hypothetical protein
MKNLCLGCQLQAHLLPVEAHKHRVPSVLAHKYEQLVPVQVWRQQQLQLAWAPNLVGGHSLQEHHHRLLLFGLGAKLEQVLVEELVQVVGPVQAWVGS